MFYIGKVYKDKSNNKHKVIMHNLHGKFPIITSDERGELQKFTREGHYYENRTSNLDLVENNK